MLKLRHDGTLQHTDLRITLCCSGVPVGKDEVAAADHSKPALLDLAGQSSLQQSETLPADCQSGQHCADSHGLSEPASTAMTSNSVSLLDQQSPSPVRVQAQSSEQESQEVQQLGSDVGLQDSIAASELNPTAVAAVNVAQEASAPAQQASAVEEAKLSEPLKDPDSLESTNLVDSDVTAAARALSSGRTGTAQVMDSHAVQQSVMQSPAGAKNVAAEMLQWLDATLAAKKSSPGNSSRAIQVCCMLPSTAITSYGF